MERIRTIVKVACLLFSIILAPRVFASNLYYVQDQFNGELFMQNFPVQPWLPHEVDFWTTDRVNYSELENTFEPQLFLNGGGATATTTTDQFVDHIDLWVSGPGIGPVYRAWYTCANGFVPPVWSNEVNSSVLNGTPQKISFIFPFVQGCNLKDYNITNFGVYVGAGNDYPQGLYFLASNTNPTPNAGVAKYIGFLDDYDVKVEIWSKSKNAFKTPVLIIPGVIGADLNKGSEKLWLDLGRNFNDVGDEFMDPLQFKSDLSPFDTSLDIGEIIKKETVNVGVGKVVVFDYTEGLIQELKDQNYSLNDNLFTFPYDWRYGVSDGVVNQLKQKIQDIVAQTGSDKVDVIAHSTGGLIVKKYVMNNPANNHIGKAVFVGVPNLGAPKALKTLLQGDSFGIPWLADSEMKKISQNLPVVYDLAPDARYVEQVGSFLSQTNPFVSLLDQGKDLDYNAAMTDFQSHNLINNQALGSSQSLRTPQFDSYDMRNNGIELYNIIGCKSGTIGKFTEQVQADGSFTYDFPRETTGDGTVPLLSAQTIPADSNHVFFAPKVEHGKMLSADGIRQQIVNLVSGSSLNTNNKILDHNAVQNNPSLCQIKGEQIKIKSPVSIGITDQDGKFSGVAEDGSIQNNIPGADYEIWGEHKYVFLPTDENQQYQIKLKGTGNGTFTLDDEAINGGATTQTQVFSNLPVTITLIGQVNLGNTTTLLLDNNGDGVIDQTISPSSVLDPSQSQDFIAPVSTSTISGLMGQAGFYRGNVSINLSVIDPIIPGYESQTSGLLKTVYSMDQTAYQTYSTSTTINITGEGLHQIKFFSTDRAGNNEAEQIINFTIDKTGPEFSMQFNPVLKDLVFSGTDNLSTTSALTILDKDDVVTVTDQAGNVTKLTLGDKERQRKLKAELKTLSYNGQQMDINKNKLVLNWGCGLWVCDKNRNLQTYTQRASSKKDFNILATFANGKTILTGNDQNGKVNKTFNGLVLLKINTNKGDLSWSY